MKPEVKARWVAALRSGEYEQGQKMLIQRNDAGMQYCCLGVLCDLAMKDGVDLLVNFINSKEKTIYSLNSNTHFLPPEVQEWSGVSDDMGRIGIGFEQTLAAMNDFGATFNEIADVIEREF